MEAVPAGRQTPAAEAKPTRPSADAQGALPNLVVIGAQKCGTSALHFYLGLHPEIAMSETKELNFFVRQRNWERGIDWYRSQFTPEAPVRGEASPNYTAHPLFRGVPARMHSVIPDAKLIYIVRDPLERIAAHWVHNRAKGRIDGLGRYVRPVQRYTLRSRYHMQLSKYLRFYPLERILILEQEDLRNDRGETLRRVFEFAGVDPGFSHPSFHREQHKTERKRTLTPLGQRLEARRSRARRTLLPDEAWDVVRRRWPLGEAIDPPVIRKRLPKQVLARLREDAELFRELTGRRFEHWSIWEL